ncbi:metallophosphoesterase family protein [Hufsiella ginkgonis]|uniref:Metallophosphoesterase n=1 Tax=Hufsiella ginkgonis TaxID=2695274 RepID=A0A7K1XX14_9SPHI|nr:metallophosphoesterase [Hufsiella ginkgonis]MXV15377.1 metallophosphoesterase [Hufsiella ginkgonis]
MKRIIPFLLFIVVALAGCEKFEFSPNQKFHQNTPENLNAINIARLQSSAGDDTVRFIVSGDPQRAYNQAEDFVAAINKLKGIDFVVVDGDLSDFGLLQEMEWVHEIYGKLVVPYVAVIGNHDLQASGEDIFRRMYGPLNYSFIYGGIKFVCHNTNSREYNFNHAVPDITWLTNEFKAQPGVTAFVGLAHVPPTDPDFDHDLESAYLHAINYSGSTLGSVYAHIDKGTTWYPDDGESPPVYTTNAIGNRECMLIEITHGILHTRTISF